MPTVTSIPEWLGAAVIGAVIAGLGYVSKLLIDAISEWRQARAARMARLLELASLLRASHAVFVKQKELAIQLLATVRERLADTVPVGGYEESLTHSFDRFSDEEHETHKVIRGLTEHAMRPLNMALSEWLRNDIDFRTVRNVETTRGQLALNLNHLDIHLTFWHAKYQAWMPDPRHALIYMADEDDHGVRFPTALDGLVDRMLEESGRRTVSRSAA